MKKVAVVYWSGTGNTEAMANLVAEGIRSKGSEAEVLTPDAFGPDKVENYDAIAFGCPSMGAEELESEEFEPMFEACLPKLKDVEIGLFGSYGWGDGEWMETWEATCREAGARVSSESVIANEDPDDDAAEACRTLGAELAV